MSFLEGTGGKSTDKEDTLIMGLGYMAKVLVCIENSSYFIIIIHHGKMQQ